MLEREIARIDRRRMLQGMVAAATAPLIEPQFAEAQSSATPKIVFAWLSPKDAAGDASLHQHVASITHLSPSWFDIGPDLTIGGRVEQKIVSFAQQHRLPLHPIVQNQNFDPAVAQQILATPTSRAQAAQTIASLVLDSGFAGINLDFEGTFGASRAQYSDFVARLAAILRPAGRWVTVDVVPQTKPLSSYSNTSWAAPYDYRALGKACNAVIMMAYAYSVSQPGPIAPLWWVKKAIVTARKQVPAKSLVVGLPFYGMHWISNASGTTATSVTQNGAMKLLAESGATLQRPMPDATPRFTWQDGEGKHSVHFDDLQSLTAKLCVVRAHGAAGVAFWRLGREEPVQWSAIAGWNESWI